MWNCSVYLVWVPGVRQPFVEQMQRFAVQLQSSALEELERTAFGEIQDIAPVFDDECRSSTIRCGNRVSLLQK